MKQMKFVQKLPHIMTADELETIQHLLPKTDPSSQVEEQLHALIRNGLLLQVDWSGEEEQNQISRFLQTRAAALAKEEIKLQLEEKRAYAAVENEGLERGDHVPYLLRFFDKRLKKHGYTISLLDCGNDAYYVVLTTVEQAKSLRKAACEFGPFLSLQAKKTKALITIYCPSCSDMSVWELPINAPFPADEQCEECGTAFSDEEGNLLVSHEKDLC